MNGAPTGAVLIASVHPARALREAYLRGALYSDFRKFGRLVRGERPEKPALYADDHAALDRILARGRAGEPIGVDIETAGGLHGGPPSWDLRPDKALVTLVAFASLTEGVSFHWAPPPAAFEFLADAKTTKVFANGFFFDIPILERHGAVIR